MVRVGQMKVRNVEGGTVPRVLLDCKGGNLRRNQKFLVLLLWYYKARFPTTSYKLVTVIWFRGY